MSLRTTSINAQVAGSIDHRIDESAPQRQLNTSCKGVAMNYVVSLAIVIALGAGTVQAKTAYCQDSTTHKRISCKTAGATPATPAANSVAATPAAPTKKPSMFAAMMKPKPVTPAAPMQSPAPRSTPSPLTTAAMASRSTRAAPHCVKGKACGNSCIKATDVCHKPG